MATNLLAGKWREAMDADMSFGLPVIVVARWVLVVSGIVFALWNAENLLQLQISVLLIIALAIANFFLHIEVTKKRAVDKRIVYGLSAADLAVVTAVILVGGEYPADQYVFYLPALAAISVTFATSITAMFAGTTAAIYGGFALLAPALDGFEGGETRFAVTVAHLVVLAAVPFCGNVYWRLEQDRRERREVDLHERSRLLEETEQVRAGSAETARVEVSDA